MYHIEVDTAKQVAANDEQKVGKIDHLFRTKKNSLAVVISILVAIDGLPIRVLAKSQRLREELGAQGNHLPLGGKSIIPNIMKHCLEIETFIRNSLKK